MESRKRKGKSQQEVREERQEEKEIRKVPTYTKDTKPGQQLYEKAWRLCNGEGVPENKVKAMELFAQAAEQGHDEALYNLAHMYDNGEGCAQNRVKALAMLRKQRDRETLRRCAI